MDSARPSDPNIYLTLQQTAQSLAVSIDVLLSWNDNNILKPTITPSGEIGYRKEQIDQFLEIRKASQIVARENYTNSVANFSQIPIPSSTPPSHVNNLNLNNQPTNNFSQVNNYNFYNTPNEASKDYKTTLTIFGIFAAFSFFLLSVFVILFSQENRLATLLKQDKNPNINKTSILSANTPATNLQEKSELNSTENVDIKLNNEGAGISQNKIAKLNKSFDNPENEKEINSKKYQEKVEVLRSILGDEKNNEAIEGLKPEMEVDYAQEVNIDNSDTEETVFDTEGNIKVSKNEAEENKLIATKLAMGGINQSQMQIIQNTSSITLVSILIIGLSTFYLLYSRKRQLFPLFDPRENLDILPQNNVQVMDNIKLIEVTQKTDGTVAILFQGKEFKVSKPEMDSESDKFIDRLLGLVGSNMKEIEYDSLQDENLSINTPLSKLVTRLGFVGIKRDLFFPRTSKSRVHFRRYLTAEDLILMNLTAEDITSGFLPQ